MKTRLRSSGGSSVALATVLAARLDDALRVLIVLCFFFWGGWSFLSFLSLSRLCFGNQRGGSFRESRLDAGVLILCVSVCVCVFLWRVQEPFIVLPPKCLFFFISVLGIVGLVLIPRRILQK